jgi:hypothetical protein
MKRHAYFLILLTFWAQFDDVLLTPASACQSAPFPSDDDEYVSSEGPEHQRRPGPRRMPQSVSVKPANANFSFVPRGVPSGWNLTTPFGPPPLYVFMSLQI